VIILRTAGTLLTLLALTVTGTAQVSGVDLQKYCASPLGSPWEIACLMYIQGFGGGIETGDGSKLKDRRMWCFPDNFTAEQAKLVVEKYMRDHPEKLHRNAAIVVGSALLLAFPCKN
jgi:hypothetical protein